MPGKECIRLRIRSKCIEDGRAQQSNASSLQSSIDLLMRLNSSRLINILKVVSVLNRAVIQENLRGIYDTLREGNLEKFPHRSKISLNLSCVTRKFSIYYASVDVFLIARRVNS